MSLRLKLLLVASILLAVPLVGYRYIVAMDHFLREHQARAALDSSRTLALALSAEAHLLLRPASSDTDPLFVHPIAQSLQIDGYDADWATLAITPHPSAINLRAASDGQALFILLRLQASVPHHPASKVRLILEDAPAFRRAWLLNAHIPGNITVYEVPPAAGLTGPAHADTRIQAAAQAHGDSLIYEIRIPRSLGISALSFEVLAPAGSGQVRHKSANKPPEHIQGDTVEAEPNSRIDARLPRSGSLQVRFAPRKLGTLLQSWTPAAGRRLRVIDTEARVLAQAGDVSRASSPSSAGAIFEHLGDSQDDPLMALAPVTLKLSGAEVDSALAGSPAVRIRRIEANGPLVVSAAYPIRNGSMLRGALILEESTSPAQALAQHALLELFLAAGGAFLIGTAVLLLISGRIVTRLRALRDQAADAIDDSGRVLKSFHAPAEVDEIGDLARSFGAAISRLQGYQDYLEKLAQRLSHELRTPLTVIRSSLDNLGMTATHQQDDVYIHRAQLGVERLESIVRRMSEAARLEQAMADSERTNFDLIEVIHAVIPAYQQSWPDRQFEFRAPATPCVVNGSAELLVQALDKLLANARDFADPDTPIVVRLSSEKPGNVQLVVCNTGARLPAGDPAQLFESMHSQRPATTVEPATESHLGFGLYIVRLVAEFHDGQAFARDDPLTRTVCIGLQLPRSA